MFKRRRNSKKKDEKSSKEIEIEEKILHNNDDMNLLSRSCDSLSTNFLSPAFSRSSNLSTSTRNSCTFLNMFSKTTSQVRNAASTSRLNNGTTSDILQLREREKKEMQKLNDHLANYIEKVRFLEAQNRKLSVDLENFRRYSGNDKSSTKTIYETELFEARKLINEMSKTKTNLENDFARLRNDLAHYRNKWEDEEMKRDIDKECVQNLITELHDKEAIANEMRRRVQFFEKDVQRLKNENNNLQKELQNVQNETNRETLTSIENQNQLEVMGEELSFLTSFNNQETKELRSMIVLDTTETNREYFKSELASAIREIRAENDTLYVQAKTEVDSRYKLKVKEIQFASSLQNVDSKFKSEESKKIRIQLGEFRSKLIDVETKNCLLERQIQDLLCHMEEDQRQYESSLKDRDCEIRKMSVEQKHLIGELHKLLDRNQSLDAEIAVYRKMLEDEAIRNN